MLDFQEFKRIFGDRVKSTGHLVCMLTPWDHDAPVYVTRCWCLFESWLASQEPSVRLEFILPAHDKEVFLNSLESQGLDQIWKTLGDVQLKSKTPKLPTKQTSSTSSSLSATALVGMLR